MKSELLNEIYRMHNLSGINVPDMLIESNLILEGGFNQLVRGVEKMLDRSAIRYAERVLPPSLERNIEKRIETYIAQRITTEAGKKEIRNFIKGLAKSSPEFAENFITSNKNTLDAIATTRGNAVAERVIKSTFGDEILTAWKSSRSVNPKPPKPPTPPIPIPSKLKDSDGVKKFQDWMNDTYPTWNSGKPLSTTGKNYGTFGKKTENAWKTYSKEYERFLTRESVGDVGITTEEEISKFQDWMKDTGRWSEDTYNLNKDKGLSEDTKKAWDVHKKLYTKTLGYEYNLKVAGRKILSKEVTPIKNGWWDSMLSVLHPATRITVFNSIRKSLWFYTVSIKVLVRDTQIEIDEIMSKFLTAIETQKVDFMSSVNLYRDISIHIAALRKSSDQRYDLFLKEIETTLKNSNQDYRKVETVMKELKQYSAFEKMFDAPETPDPRWVVEVWNESSFRTAFKGIFSEWKNWTTQIVVKFLNLAERTVMFLSTGNIRKFSEITDFMLKNGIGIGLRNYVGVCYAMKLLITPTIYTIFNFMRLAYLNIVDPDKGFWATSWKNLLDEASPKLYSRLLGGDYTVLLPWAWYWDNLDDLGDSVAQQKVGSGMREKLDEVSQKYGVVKQKADSLSNVVIEQSITLKTQAEEILRISKEKVDNTLDKGKESVQSYSVDLFFKNYPCYEAKADESYGDRGVTINGTKLTYKSSETKSYYNAIIKPDGVYWEQNGLKLTCP
jgi:hypothetical protein